MQQYKYKVVDNQGVVHHTSINKYTNTVLAVKAAQSIKDSISYLVKGKPYKIETFTVST